eukprot:COSAG06_NODE_52214_length_307_cov_0.716346_1_plen_31_part_10
MAELTASTRPLREALAASEAGRERRPEPGRA